uniref:Putative secreted protein n=1 Tax=Anopheles darlingi TaxID=43151 RepID=A0A2M4DAM6_ANODA
MLEWKVLCGLSIGLHLTRGTRERERERERARVVEMMDAIGSRGEVNHTHNFPSFQPLSSFVEFINKQPAICYLMCSLFPLFPHFSRHDESSFVA